MDLTGRVAFITGASRGIGEYTAYEFARRGASVALMAKSTADSPHRVFEGTLQQTAENARALGVEALELRGDVSHEEDVAAAYEATMARFGRCDIVVNNAAVSYVGPFLELSVKRWQILLAVNVLGPVLVCRAFLPQMLERGEGQIINVGSSAGRIVESGAGATRPDESASSQARFGESGQSLGESLLAYGTSKAALNRFTTGLAHEVAGRGVAVNCIEVSAVTQPYRYNLPDADFAQGELPEAPAQLVAWLAEQPAELTGRILVQSELLPGLREEGVIRPKVDPS